MAPQADETTPLISITPDAVDRPTIGPMSGSRRSSLRPSLARRAIAAGLALTTSAVNAGSPDDRCAPPRADEPYLTSGDFHWDYTPAELHARFDEVYGGYRRLRHRARRDPDTGGLVLPYRSPAAVGDVVLDADVVAMIRDHVETALARGLADHVFMPDMGHAHLLIPRLLYEERVRDQPVSRMPETYRMLLADPATLFVYHTAEQLRLLDDRRRGVDDPYLRHRLATRSLIGGRERGSLRVVTAPDDPWNVVRELPGYRWWGAGFHISANRSACFAFDDRGTTRWFDVSLHDLPPAHGTFDFDVGPARPTSATVALRLENDARASGAPRREAHEAEVDRAARSMAIRRRPRP